MDAKNGLPILSFASQGDWETWLDEHHRTSKGLWLKIAKKDSGIDSVNYARGTGRRALPRLDRRAEGGVRRHLLAAEVHAARPAEQVVENQCRQGAGADRCGRMKPAGLGGDRAGPERRPLGAGVRLTEQGDRARGPATRAGQRTPKRRSSSPRWTARTGTPCSTASTKPRSRRRGRGASRSSSPCSTGKKKLHP